MLTLDVDDGQMLDLTDCELDVSAVATDLSFAGISASVQPGDERHPQMVLRRAFTDAIGAAGYRVVRILEWINWGAGEHHAESVLIVDLTAIVDREALSLPDKNFQLPESGNTAERGAGVPALQGVAWACGDGQRERVHVQV